MRSGVCVKCQSTEIYVLRPPVGGKNDLGLGGSTVFSKRNSVFLTCAQCGFVERYVNPELLYLVPKTGVRYRPG